ncbi:PXA domain-containing protein [Lipomyces orientalis]|uniref:PXA domain-containing protein n=1 Tax=Lipomyces orientalis TaxID=1233043 RepID=A0ACC3TYJ0_9ASCO
MSQKRLSIPTVVVATSCSVAFGIFLRKNYTAQVAFESFVLGVFVCAVLSLAAVGYFYKHTSPRSENLRRYRPVRFPAYAFTVAEAWQRELELLSADKASSTPLYPPSFVISGSLDIIIEYILRDFILSWYSQISVDTSFPAQVENTIRSTVERIRDRLLQIDLVDFTMLKIIPIVTKHVSDFAAAETALRGKHLNKQFTESRELDIALASKYANGELHPAASLKAPDPKIATKEWIRKLVGSILPYILPEREAQSRAVFILVQEIVACSVILPVISALEEPDTWNQIIEKYASSTLQDRKAVQRLRAALDKHANPVNNKSQQPIVRLTAKSDERTYEKFVRGIRRCTLLSEARRLRYDITIQLKRALIDGNDDLFIRRLKNARRLIDLKIMDLTNENMSPSKRKGVKATPSQTPHNDPRENYTIQQLLQSSAGLSYFMEFMDRQRRTVLLQFYLVVNGFKNPLEEDTDDSDADPESAVTWSTSETWSSADKDDIHQIYNSYFNDSLIELPQAYKDDVKKFLDNQDSTPHDYRRARRAILRAQREVYDILQEEDLPKFKTSDIFLKYLTSTDPESEAQKGTVDDYHVGLLDDPNDIEVNDNLNIDPEYMAVDRKSLDMDQDGLSISVQPEDDVVQAVQAAFDDIMQSRPAADDASSNRSATSSNPKALSSNEDAVPETPGTSESPRSSLESSRINSLDAVDTAHTSKSAASSYLRSDLFGTSNSNENNIFPSESALFEETSREIFSDDSYSSEDEIDTAVTDDVGDDAASSIHRADPGDLGLTEAIQHITDDINKLMNQDAVLETLLKKAELTNNVADLRILKKSKASVEREIRRKELQRQQYIVQESDNGLYGRSTIRIQSTVSGSDKGKAYALYIIEVQRFGYGGSLSATWIVARRYSEFFQLHQHLRRQFPQVNNIDFPKKGVTMLKFQKSFIEGRKAGLEAYLRALLHIPEVCHSRELRAFLSSQDFHGYDREEGTNTSSRTDGTAGNVSAATAAAVAASTAAANGKTGKRHGSHRSQPGDLVARLYNTLSDGVDDIFGNFIVDYATQIPSAIYNAATMQQNEKNSAKDSAAKYVRTRGAGNFSTATQKGSFMLNDSMPAKSSDSRSTLSRQQTHVQLQQMPRSSESIGYGTEDHQDIAEVEAELNSYEEASNSKSGEVPFIKPICDLFLELFDLNKGNNWLRGRASVVVLQQLLGGTIERKIREQIDGIAEEGMVINVINSVRERVWPNGSRTTERIVRSPKEQAKTKSDVSFLLTTLIQDLAAKVVGSSNARHASRRLFAMLQNRILNLHVVCLIVDEVVQELFSEIKKS